MKAVILGTGRIGCGFAGQVLRLSGYEVVFLTRTPAMADYFRRVGAYRVRLVDRQSVQEYLVDGIRAVSMTDRKETRSELATADLIITAVGSHQLTEIAPQIAEVLLHRTRPVNILACENLNDAGSYLKSVVASHLSPKFSFDQVGFSGVVVNRVVSQRFGNPESDEILTFLGDPIDTWIVDGPALVESLPDIHGMMISNDFKAWIQRKLYVYSAGHAITAYLGHLKGYHYIHAAIRDPEIRAAVFSGMREGQRGLEARHGESIAGTPADLWKIISRFENAALNDPIARVGRDPKRKLAAEDRLIGPARLAQKAGVHPENLALGAAAALFFDHPSDPSATELQDTIRVIGARSVIHQISGLNPNWGLGRFISEAWSQLAAGWQRGNQLLSLNSLIWAWS